MMGKVIRLFSQNGSLPMINNIADALETATQLIGSGKVIAVPTDTIYGLAASIHNNGAIQQLYDIKVRSGDKPLAICVADIEDIEKWCHITVCTDLLNDLLPGPITVVFERSHHLNPFLNPLTPLVGVRIPDYEFIRSLSRKCGPLALTSANISSHNSTLSIDEFHDLWPKLGAVFDGGPLGKCDPLRLGSTVIDLSKKGYFKIIRDGCALQNTIKILNEFKLIRDF